MWRMSITPCRCGACVKSGYAIQEVPDVAHVNHSLQMWRISHARLGSNGSARTCERCLKP